MRGHEEEGKAQGWPCIQTGVRAGADEMEEEAAQAQGTEQTEP